MSHPSNGEYSKVLPFSHRNASRQSEAMTAAERERAQARKLSAVLSLEVADKEFSLNTGSCLLCWGE